MYKSILKQESTKPLDLNYSKYLDFANAVIMTDDNQTYTTTSKGMVFNNGYSYSWQQQFKINDIVIINKNSNTTDGSLIDALPVSSGVKITKYGANGYNFGTVMFVPFIDQTIAVPNFSKMTKLVNATPYTIQSNGCLLLNASVTNVIITYNNIQIPPSKRKFQYVIKDMIVTPTNDTYFIPIEE